MAIASLPVMPDSFLHAVRLSCLLLVIALLILAALSDLRRRRIPNDLSLAIAVLALPYGLASGWQLSPDMAMHIVAACALGAILLGGFCFGVVGGGDVKLMAALGLWLSPRMAIDALLITAIMGAVVALLILRRYRFRLSRPSVPYAVAIAMAGIAELAPSLAQLLA